MVWDQTWFSFLWMFYASQKQNIVRYYHKIAQTEIDFFRLLPKNTDSLSHTHTHTLSHKRTHTHSLSHTHTRTHTQIHTYTHKKKTQTHTYTHSHTLSLSHTHTHTRAHACTHTHTNAPKNCVSTATKSYFKCNVPFYCLKWSNFSKSGFFIRLLSWSEIANSTNCRKQISKTNLDKKSLSVCNTSKND